MTKAHESKLLAAIAPIWALPTIDEQIRAACSLADPKAHPDIRDLFRRWTSEQRTALPKPECEAIGGWKQTTQNSKEASGELRTVLDGVRRLVTVSSLYQHLITRLILSNPAGSPAPKVARAANFGRSSDVKQEGVGG
jgi:hypothetical protein